MGDTAPRRPDLADELLRRMATDQYARGVREDGNHVPHDLEQMRTVDVENIAALQRIIAEHGWPGRTLVGEDAANAAWLIAQHAPELDFQLHVLDLIDEAVNRGEATPVQRAYLVDRCLMRQQRPQIFGTQFVDKHDGRGMQLWDVTDPDRLDERRAEVGLGPHAEHAAAIRSRP